MYILEDDYVGELVYTKQNSLSLKSLDKHDHIIYIKSFSKILMPGLRLGFMIVPELLMAKGKLYGMELDGNWMHVGTPEALAEAETAFEREGA